MTLGGLALAVGILVDDATVTIENINWHLEQGKDIEDAIMDGAQQIVIPATVSLLCICIVFVPMFSLGGVAGYLVPPDGGGGRVRADRVLCPFADAGEYAGAAICSAVSPCTSTGIALPATRNPLLLFQRGFEHRFEAARDFYRQVLDRRAVGARAFSSLAFSAWSSFRSHSRPIWDSNFFPAVESTSDPDCICAVRRALRIEDTARLADNVEDFVRADRRPRQCRNDRRQHRAADQRHQYGLRAIRAPSAPPTPTS